ncbi:MAG: tetraacyldisaccharide 4'-kinase [Rhodocyclaceae bacterium]|nr:tetraacyldisaccharide 4'-kinase [Rhodocyclaceae bacterium]
MSLTDTLVSAWTRRGLLSWLLLPVSLLFRGIVALRRVLYRLGVLESVRLPRPVVVVGNLTVGGNGKTPLTLWLAQELAKKGFKPGIVSRGHGGRVSRAGEVREVRTDDDPAEVGDEPLLMARRGLCPVWVGRDRAEAGRALLAAHPECDLILCDDGLQHYRLARDMEIVVMDGRGVGNGWLLPAGPLREGLSRLAATDALVMNGGSVGAGLPAQAQPPRFDMRLVGSRFFSLVNPSVVCNAGDFAGMRVHALAGIGHPQRFFDHLAELGVKAVCHPFPDHHRYGAEDINNFDDAEALLMTEKDGVKCAGFCPAHTWVLRVDTEVVPDLAQWVVAKIMEKTHGRSPA